MNVTEFQYYRPPFAEYNEAQSLAVPYLDKDVNLVVSFPTAAGKSVLATCAFAYELATYPDKSVAYVCPSKSLAAERVREWSSDSSLSKYGIVEETSDSENRMVDNEKARLVVATIEAFDSKTRSGRWKSWAEGIRCVVFDEAHLLGERHRGGALEAAMMRFTALNPSGRVILLSATMSNTLELAKWLKSLNGKPTKAITSDWRPTKIVTKYHLVEDSRERDNKAASLTVRNKDFKTLVFVHSKRVGKELVKKIRDSKVRAVFHCASVSAKNRNKMEMAFDDRASGLNVLVATSTLAAGINLAK